MISSSLPQSTISNHFLINYSVKHPINGKGISSYARVKNKNKKTHTKQPQFVFFFFQTPIIHAHTLERMGDKHVS